MAWGGSFSILFILFGTAVLVNGILLKKYIRSHPETLQMELPAIAAAGITLHLQWKTNLPKWLPLVKIYHIISGQMSAERNFCIKTRLRPGTFFPESQWADPHRGRYRINHFVEIRDPFSLFLFRIPSNGKDWLTISSPEISPPEKLRRLTLPKETTPNRKKKEEDLNDVRKYYPGDDPRKINWKVFAHSGELFIRQGEDGTPLLESLYSILITEEPNLSRKQQWLFADHIASVYAGIASDVLASGIELKAALPGFSGYTDYRNIDTLKRDLAYALPGAAVPESFRENTGYLIVSPPDHPALQKILNKLSPKKHRLYLIFPNMPKDGISASPLSRILFHQGENRRFKNRDIALYRESADWERDKLAKKWKGAGYVETY